MLNQTGLPPLSALTERLSGPRSKAWEVTDRAVMMEREGRDIIHLSVGDPDFDTPATIVDAAIHALENGRTHYPPISGEPKLREAIAHTASKQLGLSIELQQITVFAGAQCALFATLLCLAGPGDEVILLEPFYATYEGVASAGGASVVAVPMPATNHFALDIDLVAEAITKNTRVILANSPGNPTGCIFTQNQWEALVRLCTDNHIWLVSDEVYSSIVFDCQHHSPMAVAGAECNTVVVNSVSKSHAMTGWRLGWTISPKLLATHLDNLAQCMLFGVSQFTQDAAVCALLNNQSQTTAMKEQLQSRRDTLCDRLEEIDGLVVYRPAGGMFTMVDISELGCDGEAFAEGLLEASGVAVVPGFAFGESAKNFVRIGFLQEAAILMQAADRIEAYVSGVRALLGSKPF